MKTQTENLNRTTAPSFGVVEAIEFPEIEKRKLGTGQDLYMISGGTQDVVRLELIYPAGKRQELQHLQAQATANLLFSGNEHETAAQVAEKFDYYGAFIDVKAEEDRSIVNLYSLRKNFRETASLLAEVLSEASFPENECKVYNQNQKQRLSINLEKVDFLARRAFFTELFGEEHPYGYSSSEEAYDKLSRENIKSFYEKAYRQQAPTVLLSGRIDTAEVNVVEQLFKVEATRGKLTLAENYPDRTAGFTPLRVEKKGAVQSALMLGSGMINRSHPDFPGLIFLNTLFGGYFGSRLMANIREDKGYTYGIHSSLGSPQLGGYWAISTEVGTTVAEDALKQVYIELDRLHNESIPQDEIDLVRNYSLGSFLRSVDGPFDLADRLKSLLLFDMDLSYYQTWFSEVNTINANRLQALSRQYFQKEKMVEVLVG